MPIFYRTQRQVEEGVSLELSLSLAGSKVVSLLAYPKYRNPQVEALATEFSRVLRLWFVDLMALPPRAGREAWAFPDMLEEVRRRNRLEDDYLHPQVCSSGDFCDSNMAMAEAFTTIMGHEPQPHSERDAWFWNESWSLAKRRGFQRVTVTVTPLEDWLQHPTFGTDPGSGWEIVPSPTELQHILVAMDQAMEEN